MISRRLLHVSMILCLVTVLAVSVTGLDRRTGNRTAPTGDLDFDNGTYINAANTLTFVTNYGLMARDVSNVFGYDAGCFYPFSYIDNIQNGTQIANVVFSAGLCIGGKVNGDVRVTVATYATEYTPGPIVGGTFLPGAAADPAYRTYKLHADSGATNPNQDWLDWPKAEGAPVDAFNRPLITGTQSLWAVYNDMDTARHDVLGGESLPLGVEVQQYTYAYDSPGEENSVYFRYTLHNRGTETVDSCIIGLFIDPDLGGAQDDMIGTDSAGQYVYCYNSDNDDIAYGSLPPAVGFQLLSGPVVPSPGDVADFHGNPLPDFKNLPAFALVQFVTGADPSNADSSYNLLKGLLMDGSPLVNPLTSGYHAICLFGRSGRRDRLAPDCCL